MANNYIKTGKRRGPVSAIEKVLGYGVWLTFDELKKRTSVQGGELMHQLKNHPLADYRPTADELDIEWTLQVRASRCP